jgi:hypothetical protein
MARPSKYSEKLTDKICEQLAEGKSLNQLCKKKDYPSIATVFRWLSEKPEFQDKYARARQEQAETLADEIVYIADNAEDYQKARLQVDARKWVASKLKPKKYGDRMALAGDDDSPFKVVLESDAEEL